MWAAFAKTRRSPMTWRDPHLTKPRRAQVGWPRLCFKQPPNSSGNNNRRAPRTEHDQDRNVARSKRWRKMGTLDLDDTNATHSPSGNRGLASWLRGSILPESIDGTGSFTKGAP